MTQFFSNHREGPFNILERISLIEPCSAAFGKFPLYCKPRSSLVARAATAAWPLLRCYI